MRCTVCECVFHGHFILVSVCAAFEFITSVQLYEETKQITCSICSFNKLDHARGMHTYLSFTLLVFFCLFVLCDRINKPFFLNKVALKNIVGLTFFKLRNLVALKF